MTHQLSSVVAAMLAAALISSSAVAASQVTLDFEVGAGSSNSALQGWTIEGGATAVMVNSDDAFDGRHSLLVSNPAPYKVQAGFLFTNLPNGFYSLTAWTRNSGGQKSCYLAANDRLTSLPPLYTNWTQTVVRGISVTNGRCLISICADAGASNWCRVDGLTLTNDNLPFTFLKGGDISELPRLEHYGARFYDAGMPMDCLQILKNHGWNLVRIRMYNDPGNPNHHPARRLDPLGWQNPARTIALCQRAKAMGFQIQLTFHYSDYWSNPDTQHKPHDWEGLSFTALSNALHSFTVSNLTQLADAGVFPEYVSLGNEIRGGLLFPDGSVTNAAGWDNLANLLKGGYAAVKAVSPGSQVIVHLDKVDAGNVNWFFGNLQKRGVPFDVIGCSYYPFWTELSTGQARTNINAWQGNFNQPVMIMETGYNWATNTCDGHPGQLGHNGPEPFPSTQSGQKNFLLKCINDLKLVNDGNCIGVIYWDPVFICVPGQGWENGRRNVVANTALFDFDGNTLPSLDAFQFNH